MVSIEASGAAALVSPAGPARHGPSEPDDYAGAAEASRRDAQPALSPRGVTWVAAHGGAGASTLAVVLGGTDVGCRWPEPRRTEPANVLLVARTHAAGLRAASRALNVLREGRHPAGMRLIGIVLVADAPGRLPLTLVRRIRVLRSVAPVIRIPWVPAWRLGKKARKLPKALGKLGVLVDRSTGEAR